MLILQMRNTLRLRHYEVIPTLASKQHYLFSSKEKDKKCHFYKVPTNTFTPCRHFSFVGFYSALSESTPVVTFQNTLLDLHQSSGLPWWAIIMLTTLSIRTLIVFPLAVHQNQVMARLANIKDELGKLAPELNKEVNVAKVLYKWDEKQAKVVYRKQLRDLYNKAVIRDNCHPFKAFLLVLIQMPVWVCFSVSLRNLTMMSMNLPSVPVSLNSLKTEGLFWFPDLTCPDPIVIPIMLLAVNLSLIEISSLRTAGKGKLQKVLLNFSRVVIAIVSAAATINPSSVAFYWLCSSSYGLLQNIILISPKVRRAMRIPVTSKDSLTPFKDIATNFKNRFNK